jgi:hypothetical protein
MDMLKLVTSFKKMALDQHRSNPCPMYQEALFTQEGIVWPLCADVFPVLVASDVVVTNM